MPDGEQTRGNVVVTVDLADEVLASRAARIIGTRMPTAVILCRTCTLEVIVNDANHDEVLGRIAALLASTELARSD